MARSSAFLPGCFRGRFSKPLRKFLAEPEGQDMKAAASAFRSPAATSSQGPLPSPCTLTVQNPGLTPL